MNTRSCARLAPIALPVLLVGCGGGWSSEKVDARFDRLHSGMAWAEAEREIRSVPMEAVEAWQLSRVEWRESAWGQADRIYQLKQPSDPFFLSVVRLLTFATSGTYAAPRFAIFDLDETGALVSWARASEARIEHEWPEDKELPEESH